ncbi:MAG: holin [Clostridia bacterium]|nr:holin [Clostridia bacterium]
MAAGAAYILLPWVKHKLGAARYDLLCRWVAAAVQAAEQVFSEAGMGPYKKAYVMELLEGQQLGCTEEEADALIEAEVFRLQQGREVPHA